MRRGCQLSRSAGVLLHPTCLPSRFAVGDLGPGAGEYLGWLAAAGASWWQVLPLGPPGPGFSPYSATSSFAGNPLLVSPELLCEDGLLGRAELDRGPAFSGRSAELERAAAWKASILERVCERLNGSSDVALTAKLERFRTTEGDWLADYSLFAALRRAHGGAPWWRWPVELARHDSEAVRRWRDAHAAEVGQVELGELLFARQWAALRAQAAALGIRILGDLPLFVALDSADVWAHPELFLLNASRRPTVVAGVPPDYFSPTGQLWGNPLYDWERHAADSFRWWIARLRRALRLVDLVRLDHFRGFVAHWEVPAGARVASAGRWVAGPGRAFFDALAGALGGLPFVAEDLGEITPEVVALRKDLGLPGMAILHFAFSPAQRSTFIPYALERDLVVYTGTHDNNTTVGWYEEDASEGERDLVRRYCGSDGSEIHWDLVRLALASVAELAIVPHQDLLGLGAEHRMNTPGRADGNWRFRLTPAMLDPGIGERFADLVATYGRRAAPE